MNPSIEFPKLNEFISEQLKYFKEVGLAVSIFSGEEILFQEGFGYRNLQEKLPITATTNFPIASHTKMFTATALAVLVDEGKLHWETPIKDYLLEFKLKNAKASEQATLVDLLTHVTGLPHHQFAFQNSEWHYRDIIKRLPHLDPILDFRSEHKYCNLNLILGSVIIEEISGEDYFSFVTKRILKPLGMNETNFSINDMIKIKNHTLGYTKTDEGAKEEIYPDLKVAAVGAGCINSNLSDMSKWLQFHINKGKVNGEQLISEKVLTKMYKERISTANIYSMISPENNYVESLGFALGWNVINYRESKMIRHIGTGLGITFNAGFLPKEEIGYVLFSNTTSGDLPFLLDFYTADKAMGLDLIDWAGMFKEIIKKQELAGQEKQEKEETQKEILEPTHPLEDFVGKYEHPGYGVLEFYINNNQLDTYYGKNSEVITKHQNENSFTITVVRFQNPWNITFKENSEGEISSFEILIDRQLKPVVFKKK
ncbi:MAG: serine hydrolase [Candidatus Heimdallarchaeota archaeon]